VTPALRADPEPGAFRFPKDARVRLTTEIRALFSQGKRKRTQHLDVFYLASPVSRSRLGVVVPKHRHGIVERNLLRRRLREIGRTQLLTRLHEAGSKDDLMIRARREAYRASYRELERELVEAVEAVCSRKP